MKTHIELKRAEAEYVRDLLIMFEPPKGAEFAGDREQHRRLMARVEAFLFPKPKRYTGPRGPNGGTPREGSANDARQFAARERWGELR